MACIGCKIEDIDCISIDCPITFQRHLGKRDLTVVTNLHKVLEKKRKNE